jgi:3-dehydroquinate synthase
VETIKVRLGPRSYPIHIGAGLLADRELLERSVGTGRVLIVTNDTVAPLYLAALQRSLAAAHTHALVLPDGERFKTLETFERIIDALIDGAFRRDARIVALGGGVVGDLAGFAAACYQRGIDFVQIPTTLLAQVDSAVGGKTAVNHPRAKNMIGAFHQPVAVISDTDTLRTLPPREFAAGLAEIIKYGLLGDAQFFAWLEAQLDALLALDPSALRHAVARSCEIKASIVAEDELEHGARALLNLGHTFGHALEAVGGYTRWLHGEAVAIGLSLAAATSHALGWLDEASCRRIRSLLERAGLPSRAPGASPDDVLEHMRLDKKARESGMTLVLLEAIGKAVPAPVTDEKWLARVLAAELAGETPA